MSSIFDTQRFLTIVHEKRKSPSEKRRLARRLADRQRRQGTPAPASIPAPVTTPPAKTPQEIKTIRVTRSARRQRRKVRARQRLAARSGLPELTRRLPASVRVQAAKQAARTGRQAVVPSTKGFPETQPSGDYGSAEECNELLRSRRKTPLAVKSFEAFDSE